MDNCDFDLYKENGMLIRRWDDRILLSRYFPEVGEWQEFRFEMGEIDNVRELLDAVESDYREKSDGA